MNPARREAGIRRRMRLPDVRRVLWEKANPQALAGHWEPIYGRPWRNRGELVNYSPACTYHKRERYSRKSRSAAAF